MNLNSFRLECFMSPVLRTQIPGCPSSKSRDMPASPCLNKRKRRHAQSFCEEHPRVGGWHITAFGTLISQEYPTKNFFTLLVLVLENLRFPTTNSVAR